MGLGTFATNTRAMAAEAGSGRVEAHVYIDQIYAHWIHENPQFEHPNGGKAYFLRDPLFANIESYMEWAASGLFSSDGRWTYRDAWAQNMEKLAAAAAAQTPREFLNLIKSGHPVVEQDGVTFYDRPPEVPRLPDEELQAQKKAARGRS